MNKKLFDQAKEIFQRILELPPEKHAEFLTKKLSDDDALLKEVEQLLRSNSEDPGLEHSALYHPLQEALTSQVLHPEQIGQFRIIDRIGEGGMGTIYLAQQPDPERQVALKIMKGNASSPEIVKQVKEGDLLARSSHPNVATVYEAGITEEGQHFIAMEYIDGENIVSHCDNGELTTRERLSLFIEVCHAIQHAHEQGIVHHDLKPSNILVSKRGSIPKVIDFGIALITPNNGNSTGTESNRIAGTIDYMSPERFGRSEDIDARSDIYSLGVLLYQILTGVNPLELESSKELSLRDLVERRKKLEPTPPSRSISKLNALSNNVTNKCETNKRTLKKSLSGDIDCIVLKAMNCDREGRYASVLELANDIGRFLKNEPVHARVPSYFYKASRFVSRHKIAFKWSIIALVLAFIATTIWHSFATKKFSEDSQLASYHKSIASAMAAYLQTELAQMQSNLNNCPTDLRGWEWHYLRQLSDQSVATLGTEETPIYHALFAPEGDEILTAGHDHLTFWNTDTGESRTIYSIEDEWDEIRSIAINSDASKIAVGRNNRVHVLDATNGNENCQTLGEAAAIGFDFVAFDRGDLSVVSLNNFDILTITDVVSCEWTSSHYSEDKNGQRVGVNVAALRPSSRMIALGGTSRIWLRDLDNPDAKPIVFSHFHSSPPTSIAFSSNGRNLASTSNPGTIKFWDLSDVHAIGQPTKELDDVKCAAFSPDGSRIVVGGTDYGIRTLDAETGARVHEFFGHTRDIRSVTYNKDGTQVLSTSSDGTAKVWDVESARRSTFQISHGKSFAINDDGTQVVSATNWGQLRIWDIANQEEITGPNFDDHYVTAAAYGPKGDYVAIGTGNWTNDVFIWNTRTQGLHRLGSHLDDVTHLAFEPNGERLVSVSKDMTLKVWHTSKRESPQELRIPSNQYNPVVSVRVQSPMLVAFCSGRDIGLWNVETGKLSLLKGHTNFIASLKFLDDRDWLVSSSHDGTARVWDTATGNLLRSFDSQKLWLDSVAFSPNGERLVGGAQDGTVLLWCTTTGVELLRLPRHENSVILTEFSKDGRRLISISEDGLVQNWIGKY